VRDRCLLQAVLGGGGGEGGLSRVATPSCCMRDLGMHNRSRAHKYYAAMHRQATLAETARGGGGGGGRCKQEKPLLGFFSQSTSRYS
jgi:hypothetical protein